MSYLVLARKWRPQTFEEVVGQKHVTRTLQNALQNDRLAHALLFSGARGVGKTSVARILAKALNCEQGPAPVPCNVCQKCREITAGSAVDVQEIDGASNRGIEEIRQLRENIRFHPSLCRYRIFIIDEVHMLTKEAFNALLKTLEEPPPHVYFFFATTEPRKIPATIHSRCQQYEFRRLATSVLADHLARILREEGAALGRDATLVLAREADGSVRDSLSLLDQVMAYGATSLEDVCEALGVISTQILRGLAEALLSRDIPEALRLVDDVHSFGVDIEKLLADLVAFFRHLVVLKNLGIERGKGLVTLGSEEADALEPLLAAHTPETLFQVLDALLKGQETLQRSVSPKIALETLLVRICHMNDVVGIDGLLRQVRILLDSPKSSGTARAACESQSRDFSALAPPPPSAVKELGAAKWPVFLDFVQARRPALASLLSCCQDVQFDSAGGRVCLVCRPGMQHDLLSEQDNQQRLKDLAREFSGRSMDVAIRCDLAKEAAGAVSPELRNACKGRDELVQSPLVQEAIRVFQARIVRVELFQGRGGAPGAADSGDPQPR